MNSIYLNDHTELQNTIFDLLLSQKYLNQSGANVYFDISSYYIPHNLFRKIVDKDSYFMASKFVGIANNKLYTLSEVQPAWTQEIFLYEIDLKDYTYNRYVYERNYFNNKFVCPNKVELYYSNDKYSLRTEDNSTNTNFQLTECGIFPTKYLFTSQNLDLNTQFIGFNVGSSYLDDFMYSTKSTDIFVMSLYFFIPIFLLIMGIKVLKKGLFK